VAQPQHHNSLGPGTPGEIAMSHTKTPADIMMCLLGLVVHWHSVPLLVPNISLLVPIAVNYIPSFVSLQLPKMIQIISMDVENCLLTFTLE